MKAILTAAILLLLGQQTSSKNGEIEGLISRTDSRAPISDVRISVQNLDLPNATIQTTTTDSAGRFLIRELPEGNYLVRAERQGYLPSWGAIPTPDSSASVRVTVKPGDRVSSNSLTLIPGATVEGRVLNPDNSPAAGLTVELLQQTVNPEGVRQWLTVGRGGTTTDDRGQFRVAWFGPGKYFLRAISRPPVIPGALQIANSVQWMPTTYFPGILNPALASPVEIQVGQTVNVDLRIPQSNPYTVSGKIVNSVTGQTPQPIQLVLTRREYGAPLETSSWSLETLNLAAGSDGKFEIRGVPSGSYELFATMRGQITTPGSLSPNLTWVARTTFDVADQDIDNISAVLKPGVDVKGKLTVLGDSAGFHLFQSAGGGGGRIDGTQVDLRLRANDGSTVGSLLPPKIDGETFLVDNVPEGTYSISVSVAGERRTAYVADIRSAGRSIFGESIVVGSTGAEPLEIVVNTNGASVPITVVGKPDHEATVVLVPAPQYRKNPHRYRYSAVSDPSGKITVNYVAPGDYTVYAWDYPPSLPLPYMDPEFIAKHGARGVRINITGQPLENVEVPVVRINPFE
jgi:hypothetical protein